MTYADKLKDPRWQKRRLEVLDRDNWKCRRCGNDGKTLHVHHLLYLHSTNEDGVRTLREPWDAPRNDIDQPAMVKKLAKYPGGASGLIGDSRGLREYRRASLARCVGERVIDHYNSGRRVGKLDPL